MTEAQSCSFTVLVGHEPTPAVHSMLLARESLFFQVQNAVHDAVKNCTGALPTKPTVLPLPAAKKKPSRKPIAPQTDEDIIRQHLCFVIGTVVAHDKERQKREREARRRARDARAVVGVVESIIDALERDARRAARDAHAVSGVLDGLVTRLEREAAAECRRAAQAAAQSARAQQAEVSAVLRALIGKVEQQQMMEQRMDREVRAVVGRMVAHLEGGLANFDAAAFEREELARLDEWLNTLGGPAGALGGWSVRVDVRRSGESAGGTDVYFFNAAGRKFRSLPEVARFWGLAAAATGVRAATASGRSTGCPARTTGAVLGSPPLRKPRRPKALPWEVDALGEGVEAVRPRLAPPPRRAMGGKRRYSGGLDMEEGETAEEAEKAEEASVGLDERVDPSPNSTPAPELVSLRGVTQRRTASRAHAVWRGIRQHEREVLRAVAAMEAESRVEGVTPPRRRAVGAAGAGRVALEVEGVGLQAVQEGAEAVEAELEAEAEEEEAEEVVVAEVAAESDDASEVVEVETAIALVESGPSRPRGMAHVATDGTVLETAMMAEAECSTAGAGGCSADRWTRLELRCALSLQRLVDPAKGSACTHMPRCNYNTLRDYVRSQTVCSSLRGQCPIAGCKARLLRTSCIERADLLRRRLAELPADAMAAWVSDDQVSLDPPVSAAVCAARQEQRKRRRAVGEPGTGERQRLPTSPDDRRCRHRGLVHHL